MKLGATLTIRPTDPPWFVAVSFNGAPEQFMALKERIKQFPGRKYDAATKSWLVPREVLSFVIKDAAELGFTIKKETP